ncbi:hypothetical protein GQ43DRAFT_432472 [Delitschia confertaspora ATCC 74209]|uniref:Uncharacterized protein n=1 Tax=Delitschia confertaspora ATCC 74209 TaxID=1513339 RepID=A0A9P4MRJ2_9PLEO|nr:hypothetical protein GQ43DRAFT_432472 [Delitschia confertaspora ATCC 74209]
MSKNLIQKTPSNRLPAPTLFVGPPSRNASNTSLSPNQPPGPSSRVPLTRTRSHRSHRSHLSTSPAPVHRIPSTQSHQPDTDRLSLFPSNNPTAPFTRRQQAAALAADAEASSHAEAIWAEMQNTLEEVELSAIKGPGMDVFGAEHSRALDELRRAQIELAKAWARSEADEGVEGVKEKGEKGKKGVMLGETDSLSNDRLQKLGAGGEKEKEREREKGGPTKGRTKSATGFERSRLEEETDSDIELSRKRREANDRYFEKVNKGVLEVVMKLEEVANAMKGVELESREIWRDEESVDSSSVKTTQSTT